ncbi:hypothetical protein M8J75_012918 [Diaphorina citri]|nr:hypothetical protein M8J75_012918 [Diaphorina citri]KAI5714724.1 hypothetical protein M8J77_004500 [Diaphorina citri]
MCFLFNNVNFLFLLLFIINVKSDDRVVHVEYQSGGFSSSNNDFTEGTDFRALQSLNHTSSVKPRRGSSRTTSSDLFGNEETSLITGLKYSAVKGDSHSSVNNQTSDKFNYNNESGVFRNVDQKSSDRSNSLATVNKVDSREIHNKNSSNELYYEILQTKPNSTIWSKFEFLIKPFVDKSNIEESNGIIFSKRKNLTLPNNSSLTSIDKSNDGNINQINSSNNGSIENKILLRTERNTSHNVNITDRHFNSNKFSQDAWTQVSTLESNKDQVDRFKYASSVSQNTDSHKPLTKPTESSNSQNLQVDGFNSLKRHTLATLYNKHEENTHPTSAYSNIHSVKYSGTSPSYFTTPTSISSNSSTVTSSSLTTLSNLQKPFGTTSSSSAKDHFGSNYQTVSTKLPNENQKQIAYGQGQVVSTTHKSWINQNKHDLKATNDYYSAIITAADAIKNKHKPVSSTETVLFPYYDDELVTPVLISSTKKPMTLSSTTKKPLFSSSTKKPFSPIITLTKKPDYQYQTEVETEDDEEEEEAPEQEEAEYEETTTQVVTTKKPYKPLFVSSTAQPVFTKRPYVIRPVINVISQPLTTTGRPAVTHKPSTTTTQAPTTEKQLTTALTSASTGETDESDDEDDDEDDSDASEERKRRRKRPQAYISPYPIVHSISSQAPYLVYQQPLPQIDDNGLDKDTSEGSDDDEDDDDDFFINPLADDDEDEDDEIVEETVEVHKSPHGHIYDDYPLLSKKKKKKFFKKKKHGHGFKVKDFKKLKKFMLPLLLAYKLKFFTMVPLLLGGLVLIVGTTGFAGFFFALFAVGLGLRGGHK